MYDTGIIISIFHIRQMRFKERLSHLFKVSPLGGEAIIKTQISLILWTFLSSTLLCLSWRQFIGFFINRWTIMIQNDPAAFSYHCVQTYGRVPPFHLRTLRVLSGAGLEQKLPNHPAQWPPEPRPGGGQTYQCVSGCASVSGTAWNISYCSLGRHTWRGVSHWSQTPTGQESGLLRAHVAHPASRVQEKWRLQATCEDSCQAWGEASSGKHPKKGWQTQA